MKEAFLHYLWNTKQVDFRKLKTTNSKVLKILDHGQYNEQDGPDFLNGKIFLEGTTWVGPIEMHLKSSDWLLHKHELDRNYDNVILHVVLEEDQIIYNAHGVRIPCLELRKLIPKNLKNKYQKHFLFNSSMPCKENISSVSLIEKKLMLEKAVVERLELKVKEIESIYRSNKDLASTFFIFFCSHLGGPSNKVGFSALAENLELKILQKYKDRIDLLEAILLGTAGLLIGPFQDDYPNYLKKEFYFLQTKHQLNQMNQRAWKLLGLRPLNFPTIRLAQLAALLHKLDLIYNDLILLDTAEEICFALEACASEYYSTHYLFDKESSYKKKRIGKSTKHNLIINVLAPFTFFLGQKNDDDFQKEKALDFLSSIQGEQNKWSKFYKKIGFPLDSALDSQGMIQLKKSYCDKQQCLRCRIGHQVLKS